MADVTEGKVLTGLFLRRARAHREMAYFEAMSGFTDPADPEHQTLHYIAEGALAVANILWDTIVEIIGYDAAVAELDRLIAAGVVPSRQQSELEGIAEARYVRQHGLPAGHWSQREVSTNVPDR